MLPLKVVNKKPLDKHRELMSETAIAAKILGVPMVFRHENY